MENKIDKTLSCTNITTAEMVSKRHFQAYNGCQQCGEEQKRPHSLCISELSGLSVLWRKRGCPMIVQLPTEYALLGIELSTRVSLPLAPLTR